MLIAFAVSRSYVHKYLHLRNIMDFRDLLATSLEGGFLMVDVTDQNGKARITSSTQWAQMMLKGTIEGAGKNLPSRI